MWRAGSKVTIAGLSRKHAVQYNSDVMIWLDTIRHKTTKQNKQKTETKQKPGTIHVVLTKTLRV
ncbi:rCG28702 [Rattus norvegicus]|uniref:RCG28702 n=1 Tax=Rattus norvegicus TaxID=10116 RepID=A6HW49_RAT|nr:rCG28702 [Rattus norvegicus]